MSLNSQLVCKKCTETTIVSQTAAKAIKTRARLYTIRLAYQHVPLTLCTGFED